MDIYVYRYDDLRLSVHEWTTGKETHMENTLEKNKRKLNDTIYLISYTKS